MNVSELNEKAVVGKATVVAAKKKKRGGYTIYPQVVDVVHTNLPVIGECYAVVFED